MLFTTAMYIDYSEALDMGTDVIRREREDILKRKGINPNAEDLRIATLENLDRAEQQLNAWQENLDKVIKHIEDIGHDPVSILAKMYGF